MVTGMRSFRSNRPRWFGVDLGESGSVASCEHAHRVRSKESRSKRAHRSRKSGFASPMRSLAPFHVDPLRTFKPVSDV